jgi:hypothetical protein
VTLETEPTAAVTIPVSVSDHTEGMLNALTEVVVEPAAWSTGVTFNVMGLDDFIDDGDVPYALVAGLTTSADFAYDGVDPADVDLINTDDDTAGVAVVPSAEPILTSEDGTVTGTFTVVLATEPIGTVTIDVFSNAASEGQPDVAQLTFSSADWAVPQTVTVNGVDDSIDDGDVAFAVQFDVSAPLDPPYLDVSPPSVACLNQDDDTAGIVVGGYSGSGLTTAETGIQGSFWVALATQPTSAVTVPVTSDDPSEGAVGQGGTIQLVFTPTNWATQQDVTVTGVDDALADGDVAYTIKVGPSASADTSYAGLMGAPVNAINMDNDAPAVDVIPVGASVTTTEAGGFSTIQIVLRARPSASVVVPVDVSDPTEAKVDYNSLTFTPDNWNAPQTVTVTGLNDSLADGPVAYTVDIGPTTSADPAFNGLIGPLVNGSNTDDETAGITVDPVAGLVTTERGGTATFTVVLNSEPYADVTIPVVSGDATEGTVSPTSLVFTPVNWRAPQTVTVTGVDDWNDDGDTSYTIEVQPATSTDLGYNGMDGADVAVSNTDDESAGITVAPTAGLSTSEAGGQATFTVVLNSQPTSDVTIGLSSSHPDEGTPGVAQLVFTPDNWNAPQPVTVTGVDDPIIDGGQPYSIILAAAVSGDVAYAGLDPADVAITNVDNDSAGYTVTPTGGLETTEGGGTASFTMVLNAQPTADVTIGITSNNIDEGTVSTPRLVFTSDNWNAPQTVTITGVDDDYADGNQPYTIVTARAVTTDENYMNTDPANVSATNNDNDSAGFAVTPQSLTVSEDGTQATFTVVLTSKPLGTVTVGVSTSDGTEVSVTPDILRFTVSDWNAPRSVTVTGEDDWVADGNQVVTVFTAQAVSSDATFNGLDPDDVTVTCNDNDSPGFVVALGAPTLNTTEAGGQATFTVRLSSEPFADVTLPVSVTDATEGSVDVSELVFTPLNWQGIQTVHVTGLDDYLADGNQVFRVTLGPSISADTGYQGLDPADPEVTNTDDDSAGIKVTAGALVTTEAGDTATFEVVLMSQPYADVTIAVASSDTTEGTVNPAALVFTPVNWNAPQVVTVTGVEDYLDDGNQTYTITLAAAVSDDLGYSGKDPDDLTASNTDNDTAGITVAPLTGLSTTEGGATANLTVVLNSEPTADVTVAVESSDLTEGTVTPDALVFTSLNWSSPQVVTIKGEDDPVADGNVQFQVRVLAAVSLDATYNGMDPLDATVTNNDNDQPGIAVTPTSGLQVDEAGTTEATFSVVLMSQPMADVTIGLSVSDATEGSLNTAQLVFTVGGWNAAQFVTVKGVDDSLADGNQVFNIITAPAVSSDANYSGLNADDVEARNQDDDVAGFIISATDIVTAEPNVAATFTVRLTSQPTANVTIAVASNDATEGVASPASLVFSAGDWNTAKTVTVTGQNDAVADGNVPYKVVLGPVTGGDTQYTALDPNDVNAVNNDDDTAGITVTPVSGLVTTEGGGTATFTVVLTSQPTANVTIGISSLDATEGSVSPTSLVFTALNWNTARTVTVTGANDDVDDGNILYTIQTAAAVSADPGYSGKNPPDVTVTNTDNDTAGITLSTTGPLTTTENLGTASFTVRLATQPTAAVTIGIASNDTTEGTTSVSQLIFSTANWNTVQPVTITGVNDDIDDDNISYLVVTAPATSTDPVYSGMDASDVSVSNTDNDTAGITVSPVSGLTTTEAGGVASFTVKLNTEPVATVTIGLTSNDLSEGTVSPASLSFTAGNWSSLQLVTVTGVNDNVDDNDIAYAIVTAAATSTDTKYNGMNPSDVAVTNTDDDTAGITVTPLTLATNESGTQATYTIRLNSQPTAAVTVGVTSGDTTEGTVSPASAVIAPANWQTGVIVTVTGVDDATNDNDVTYTVTNAAATSTDPKYAGFDPADVSVTNVDNDVPGITFSVASITTREPNIGTSFTIRLNTQPQNGATVTIPLSSSDTTEGTVSPPSLSFTPANWMTPQTVTVAGADDLVDDGDIAYSIVTAAATCTGGTDADYCGRNFPNMPATNIDNDTAGFTISPTAGLVTSEAGATASFTVRLTSLPSANVTLGLSSSDTTEGTVDPPSLVFSTANWSTPQTVTITGVNDNIDDDAIAYQIVTAAAVSGDATYNGINPTDVSVTNNDNDTRGVTVSPLSGLVTTEIGGTATFTVRLNTEPTASVTIAILSLDTTEGTAAPASLVFTTLNWNTNQTVTVTGRNDSIDDGDILYTISTEPAVSADAKYNGFNASNVTATNIDNDTAGYTIGPMTLSVNETSPGNTATFTVRLNTEPVANVTMGVTSNDTTEGTVSPASLVFTSANWFTAQTVTVTAVNDDLIDGNRAWEAQNWTPTGGDPVYTTLNPANVAVTTVDTDYAGFVITPTSTVYTTEAGGTGTFTIKLTAQPTANVTLTLTNGDTTEGTVNPTSYTFTSANWNVDQTATVTGVDDFVDDGNIYYWTYTNAATSADANFNGVNPSNVYCRNADDDTAGITITPTSGLETDESGMTDTFTVVLNSEPLASVAMNLSVSDSTEVSVSPASLTFTTANWNAPQTVTVTGKDDTEGPTSRDGNQSFYINTAAATSTDSLYNGVNPPNPTGTNYDKDFFITNTRVSQTPPGGPGGSGLSSGPADMSEDGRFIVFVSHASNLVGNDANGYADIFMYDALTYTMTLVSVATNGTQANAGSDLPAISPDGRYVAFQSTATNLVTGDTNVKQDVFLRDTQNNTTTLVSASSAGVIGNGDSWSPSVANGGTVVFASDATNLVTTDTNGKRDIFMKYSSGGVTLISVNGTGGQGDGDSYNPTIASGLGFLGSDFVVAFESNATNLVTGDTNARRDVFVRRSSTSLFPYTVNYYTEIMSVSTAGTIGNSNSWRPRVSLDGRTVVFASDATNLVSGDTNGLRDIFQRVRSTSTTTRVNTTSGGVQASGGSSMDAWTSRDGVYVTFASNATNLSGTDTNAVTDIYVKNTTTGAISVVSQLGGIIGNAASTLPCLSGDGRYVGFVSQASNLIAIDNEGYQDIFVVLRP